MHNEAMIRAGIYNYLQIEESMSLAYALCLIQFSYLTRGYITTCQAFHLRFV
jgi:hypothetical protein